MRYELRGNGLRGGRAFGADDDVDPMSSLANLADVMLVMAAGLMMALVVFWNVQLPDLTELDESQIQSVDDVEEMVDQITATDNPYMEMGTVYQDPTTGKMYVLAPEETGADKLETEGGSNEAAAESQEATPTADEIDRAAADASQQE